MFSSKYIIDFPVNILKHYDEYLKLVNYYVNEKTYNSVPVRYYNIDVQNSKYDEDALLTFDSFRKNLTGIIYNVYEFTPVFYTSPIIDMTSFDTTKDFSRFNQTISIQIYTIPHVYIGDLVQFYHPDSQSNNVIYRVVNFRVPLNTISNIPIYELDLEPASVVVKDTLEGLKLSINIGKRYIYDYSMEKYVPFNEFNNKLTMLNIIETQFRNFLKKRIKDDLLYLNINGDIYMIYEINELVYNTIVNSMIKFKRINIPLPYGVRTIKKPKKYKSLTSYSELITTDNTLHYLQSDVYKEITIPAQTINLDSIDWLNFNISNYNDVQNVIILLYLFEKLYS